MMQEPIDEPAVRDRIMGFALSNFLNRNYAAVATALRSLGFDAREISSLYAMRSARDGRRWPNQELDEYTPKGPDYR